MQDWSNKKMFFAETARIIIFALVASTFTYFFLYERDKNASREAEIKSAELVKKSDLIDDFLHSSFMYGEHAYDACNAESITDSLLTLEDSSLLNEVHIAYDRFKVDQNKISLCFLGDEVVDRYLHQIDSITGQVFSYFGHPEQKNEWNHNRDLMQHWCNKLAKHLLVSVEVSMFKD